MIPDDCGGVLGCGEFPDRGISLILTNYNYNYIYNLTINKKTQK